MQYFSVKTHLAFLLTLLFTLPAFTKDGTNEADRVGSQFPPSYQDSYPNEAPFDKLERLYEIGELPTREELNGWFTGRCYNSNKSSQHDPMAGILVGTYRDKHGPLIEATMLIFVNTRHTSDPGMYDDLSANEIDEIRGDIGYRAQVYSIAVEKEGAIMSSWKGLNLSTMIRKVDNYFISKNVFSEFKVYDNLTVYGGEIMHYCYFFKKVYVYHGSSQLN